MRNWLTRSSTNPEKIALTIKGFAVFAPSIIALTSLIGIHGVTSLDVNAVLNSVATTVVAIFAALSGLATLYGLLRKIYLSAVR